MNMVTRLSEGPLPAYRARVEAGALRPDPAQAHAAELLQGLWQRLRGYAPPPLAPASARSGLLGKLFGLKNGPAKPARKGSGDLAAPPPGTPQGLYLVGQVGRGKSMLMDLFFETAEVPRKRRLHFHAFMQEAHQRIHDWKRTHPAGEDPIPPLADSIAAEASLLCFDEFQVHDIADAMILGRLFEALFARGVVVVATSNTAPKDLFKGRPGRDAFLPFIALIERQLEVIELESAQDYRRHRMQGAARWHVPADGRAERALDAAFLELTGTAHGAPVTLTVHGRNLEIPEAAGGVARMGFEALCGAPLGPGDYLALARHFHTLILDGIPRLGPENFDRARRFITLVDALYDHRCQLFASAAAPPDQLYERGENAAMFERTASRLVEMQSLAYFDLPHLP
ncbi:cell division protein ZapE [Rubritepida flocculans]|uniref:cell division protein ZapE n=1 Tax=Rubritepida flocculans TaxID=182403 RepID=UPI0003F6ACBC|nr:cell division protein ZapE [Rubritepida flocculans]